MPVTKKLGESEFLQLYVEGGETQDPVAKVRWCVSPLALQQLDNEGAKNVHILLVTKNQESRHEHRYLVPLKRMFSYVEFHRSGNNTISACIVWDNEADNLWNYFMRESGGEYVRSVLDYSGELSIPSDGRYSWKNHFGSAKANVFLEPGFFAKEPAAWEKTWVNLWFGRRMPNDQCQFRRRRMIAYTIQPPLVIFWLIFKFIVCLVGGVLCWSVGSKSVDFRPVIHPWLFSIDDTFEDVKYGQWFFKTPFTFFLKPIFPFIFLVVGIVISMAFGQGYGQGLLNGVLGYIIVSVVIESFVFIIHHISRATRKNWKEKPPKPPKKYVETLDYLLCRYVPSTGALVIPEKRRTVIMRYQALKALVCRPFPE